MKKTISFQKTIKSESIVKFEKIDSKLLNARHIVDKVK